MYYGKMNLQMFADGDGGNGGNAGSNTGNSGNSGNGVTYSFEQAEQIANDRANRASRSALTNYFQQQGMTPEQAQEAFNDFKEKQKANRPDVSAITRERDEARAELASYKNRSTLSAMNVEDTFTEFVENKVNAMVTDKKDFKAAATEFLKSNPQYVAKTGYRFSSGSAAENRGSSNSVSNSSINDMIRSRRR